MEPYTSIYAWPDGQTYTCFVFINPSSAAAYQISGEIASSIYPNDTVHRAVRKVALNRFKLDED